MVKRTHEAIRKALLEALSDGKEHSYGDLERKVNTNWKTVRDHCRNLDLFGAVSLSKAGKVRLTKDGQLVWKKMAS